MYKVGIRFDTDEPQILARFSGVLGLEGEFQDEDDYTDVTLKNCDPENDFISSIGEDEVELDNTYICILQKESIIGEYFMADVTAEIANVSSNRKDLVLNGYFPFVASAGTMKSLDIITCEVLKPGMWRSLKEDELQGWLEVALKKQTGLEDKKGVSVEIDGKDICCIDAFYCALGEAVNGPGGYFGRNLDALSDCFCRGFGVIPPMKIKWNNFYLSKSRIPDFEEFYSELLHIFSGGLVELEID